MGPLRRDFLLTRAVILVDTFSNHVLECELQHRVILYEVETTGVLPMGIHPLPKESFHNGK
ncbi:MAG: hypothetical protein OXT71_21720 [Acidobacteriota bacterium]|nr:hypothetical protein [Acidobacteriota bacterium]